MAQKDEQYFNIKIKNHELTELFNNTKNDHIINKNFNMINYQTTNKSTQGKTIITDAQKQACPDFENLVELVIDETGCSKQKAINALNDNNFDCVHAIISLYK